ncbi:MAG: hypothetical protein IKW58_00440 [Alphaproteobacteria bacterium]|nr:hypothetical protein [Alphaproteobacteria bacterium]
MNATPSNQLNEFVIFQAFTQNQSFTHALKDIRKHNKTVPDDKKIDTQSKNNVDALRLSFGVFKKAEQKLSKQSPDLNFDDPKTVSAFRKMLEETMREAKCDKFTSSSKGATIEKLKIGNLILNYTKYVSTYGKQTLFALQRSEIKRHRNAQAMTKNHGPIKHVRVVPKDPSEKDNKPEFRPLDDLINSKFGRG